MPYLLTFRTYGTHLPGNPQGTNQRNNRYLPASPALENHVKQTMRQPGQHLTRVDAELVLQAIQEVAQSRHWELIAAHVRTTHVHLIADDFANPIRAIAGFKAYATQALRRRHQDPTRLYWARGGDIRRLGTTEALRAAIHYVVNRQGEPMAVYRK